MCGTVYVQSQESRNQLRIQTKKKESEKLKKKADCFIHCCSIDDNDGDEDDDSCSNLLLSRLPLLFTALLH